MNKSAWFIALAAAVFLIWDAAGAMLDVAENVGAGSPLLVEAADLEGDAHKEIVINSGDGVYVLESDGSRRWFYAIDNVRSFHVSDTNSDGVKEVLVAAGAVYNNKERGNLYVIDASGNLLYKYEYFTTGKWYPQFIYNSMESADMDSDRYKELVVACSGGVYALGDTFDRIRWAYSTDEAITKVSIINTSEKEGEMLLANSFHSIYLLTFNGSLARNLSVNEGIKRLITAEIYPEPGEEILLVTDDDVVSILSSNLTTYVSKNPADGISDAAVVDLDGDKYKEFALVARGYVHVLDNRLGEYGRYKLVEDVIGLETSEWDGEDGREIVFSSGRGVYWINKYGELLGSYPTNDAVTYLTADDLDFDGYTDVVAFTANNVILLENKALKIKDDAKELYAQALGYVAADKYDEAKKSLEEATRLYTEIGDLKSINLCRNLDIEIESKVIDMKTKEAESYCESAARHYAGQDRDGAAEYLEKAKRRYDELNLSFSDSKCDEVYLKMIEEEKTEDTAKSIEDDVINAQSEINIMQLLSIALLVVILIGLVVLLFKKNEKG